MRPADDIEADVARRTASRAVLGAKAAMPNLDLVVRQLDGLPCGGLLVEALFNQFLLDLHATRLIAGERLLVRTIARTVVNDVGRVKAQLTGTGKVCLVALPCGIARMKCPGTIDKKRKGTIYL